MAYSEELAARVAEILQEGGPVDEKKMFGGLAFMVDGYMCCGIVADKLMLRLGEDGAAQAIGNEHVEPMDFTGKTMKAYVFVGPEAMTTEDELRAWIAEGRAFIATLPPR